jgi:hypothetical protein
MSMQTAEAARIDFSQLERRHLNLGVDPNPWTLGVVGLWPIKDAPDPLHQALRKYAQAPHVGDLNRESLLAFCEKSWNAGRAALAKMDAPCPASKED